MGLKNKNANTREFTVGRQVEKIGKQNQRKRKYAQKISTFQNTTKAIRATGHLLSSIPKKITQGTYIEDKKSINTIQLETSFISSVKRKDSGLHHVCSENVVHSVKH